MFGAHLFSSRILDAYVRVPSLDVPMHLFGGLAIAFFFHSASRNGSRLGVLGPFHPFSDVLLVFGLTCAAAVFWEFAEFLSDRYLGTHAQGDDLKDTLLDMLLGILGGMAFLGAWLPFVSRPDESA